MDRQMEQLTHSSSLQRLCSLAQCRTGHRVVCHLWLHLALHAAQRRKCIAQRYCWFYYSSKEPFSKEHRGRIERRIILRVLFAKLYDWLNHRCFFKAGHHWDLMQVFSAVGCIYSAYCFLFINFCLFFLLWTFERMLLILQYLFHTCTPSAVVLLSPEQPLPGKIMFLGRLWSKAPLVTSAHLQWALWFSTEMKPSGKKSPSKALLII